MGDMGDLLRSKGLKLSPAPHGPESRGVGPREPARAVNSSRASYPDYFNNEGYIRSSLLREEAEQAAREFSNRGLTRHQLRAFYNHAKEQLERLRYGAPFGEVLPEIIRLREAAADRSARGGSSRIPFEFKRFIDANVDAVRDKKSFEKGFMPHFEAVVAYFPRERN